MIFRSIRMLLKNAVYNKLFSHKAVFAMVFFTQFLSLNAIPLGFEKADVKLISHSCLICATQLANELQKITNQKDVDVDIENKEAHISFMPGTKMFKLDEIESRVNKGMHCKENEGISSFKWIKVKVTGKINVDNNNFVLVVPGFNHKIYLYDEKYIEPYKRVQPSNKGLLQLTYSYSTRSDLKKAAELKAPITIVGKVHDHADGSLAINVEEKTLHKEEAAIKV